MSDLLRTPLYDVHHAAGARLIDFAGWEMPVWYDSATDEHHAVRNAAGLFDLGHMAELFVRGPQAADALDHALVRAASPMPAGRARYSMMCTPDGGIIDDLIVYRLGDDEFMVVANASNGPTVYAELVDRAASFDAAVDDDTGDWGLLAIQGPASVTIAERLVGPTGELRYYRIDACPALGERAWIARTGYTGEDGFELFVPGAETVDLWQRLLDAGVDESIRPVGLAARDTLRLEAGMPLYGNELSLDTTPFDVGAGRIIDLDRAFVGRDALAAAGPHRALVGLHVQGRRPAREGYGVLDGDRSIGVVTSGTLSPTLERPIAIALVDEALESGTELTIDVRGKPTSATTVDLPFYTRPDNA